MLLLSFACVVCEWQRERATVTSARKLCSEICCHSEGKTEKRQLKQKKNTTKNAQNKGGQGTQLEIHTIYMHRM